MSRQIVLSLAPCPLQPCLSDAARDFGWSVERAASIPQASTIALTDQIIAILFQTKTLLSSPLDEVRLLRSHFPDAKPIVCYTFSDNLDWPRLAVTGAYDALLLPLDAQELRRSLGFVWSAISKEQERLRARSGLRVVTASAVA